MILCIDTATDAAGAALVDAQSSSYLSLDLKSASETLLATIDQLLKDSNVKLSDLKGVMVIKGPGSFTGLRVGIAVANQFAHQLNIPIIGLRSEEWYYSRTDEKDFLYLQSMNRDQVYVIGFGSFENWSDSTIVSIGDLEELAKGRWLGQLTPDHQSKISLELIGGLRTPEEAWQSSLSLFKKAGAPKKYYLVEPFYAKEPTITKSKRKLSI